MTGTAGKDLATPDPVRLTALKGTRQARRAQRARPAVRLRRHEVGGKVREPQVRVLKLAR
jgi:hypothetical protein